MLGAIVCSMVLLNSQAFSAPTKEIPSTKFDYFQLQPLQSTIGLAYGNSLNRVPREAFVGYGGNGGFGALPSYSSGDGYGPGYTQGGYRYNRYLEHYHRRRNGDLLPLSVITIG